MDQIFTSLFETLVTILPRPWNWIAGLLLVVALVSAIIWVLGGF